MLNNDPDYPGQISVVLKATGFISGETVRITLISPQGKQTIGQAVADQAGVVSGKIVLGPTAEVIGEWQLELLGKQQTLRGTLVVHS